jgi:hypothetical protein
MPEIGDRVRVAITTVGKVARKGATGVIGGVSHLRSTGEESMTALIGKVKATSGKKAPAKVAKARKSGPTAKKVAKTTKSAPTAKRAVKATKASAPVKKAATKTAKSAPTAKKGAKKSTR